MTEVWSCGGGTQSAAIAVLILQGRLPKPDVAIIVDTEREKESTWAYYALVQPKLLEIGVDLVRVKKSEFATVDMVSTHGKILLPGYTLIDGKPTKQSGFCSNEWKKRVVQRYCRSIGVKKCRNWLGISTDEMRRVRQSDQLWWQNRYPLIFDVPLSRSQCIELVVDYG